MEQMPSGERQSLCAYIAGRDGMVKLRMPFGKAHLEDLMKQESLPELVVFLDSHVNPVLVMKEERIQFCMDNRLGMEMVRLLEQRKGRDRGYGGNRG